MPPNCISTMPPLPIESCVVRFRGLTISTLPLNGRACHAPLCVHGPFV